MKTYSTKVIPSSEVVLCQRSGRPITVVTLNFADGSSETYERQDEKFTLALQAFEGFANRFEGKSVTSMSCGE